METKEKLQVMEADGVSEEDDNVKIKVEVSTIVSEKIYNLCA
jgi:hypothetical protein